MERLYTTKLTRLGNSDAIIVPVDILRGLGWRRGDNLIMVYAPPDMLGVRRIGDEEVRELKRKPPVLEEAPIIRYLE